MRAQWEQTQGIAVQILGISYCAHYSTQTNEEFRWSRLSRERTSPESAVTLTEAAACQTCVNTLCKNCLDVSPL